MNQSPFNMSSGGSNALTQAYMQRVYKWMALGLTLTGVIAFLAAGNIDLMRAIHGGPLRMVLFIAQIGIVFWLSFSMLKLSPKVALIGFFAYAGINGLTLSYVFLVYTSSSIASTFFVTAGTFAAVSLYGWTTKRDISSWGGFLMMALIGMIIASLVNMFLRSEALYWILSYVGVAVAIGITAWDTQKLKAIHENNPEAPEQLAIYGALSLYLDFILMFVYLLRILGNRR